MFATADFAVVTLPLTPETRGHIDKGAVAHWQVTVKIGFTLEDGT